MNPKDYLTNDKFCPIPWTGFQYNSNGDVLNCIRSQRPIGNLKDNNIFEILGSNTETKQNMLEHKEGLGCSVCYDLEKENKGNFDIISDRVFYLKELKDVPLNTYDSIDQFKLRKIDIRWSNNCNHACVYCSPEYSSKWAKELKIKVEEPPEERVEQLQRYVFRMIPELKHVYLAGGEPLLMKENEMLLRELLKRNPNVNLRVNTNLSKTGTPVFDLICQFKNVHWTVSVDEIENQFEYVRYGGSWSDFLDNLTIIKELNYKISFNMLYHILNFKSLFETIDYFQRLGFHNNSFVIGPLTLPPWQDVRNLPDNNLDNIKKILDNKINESTYLLKESYKNLLTHVNKPFNKDLETTLKHFDLLDTRRGTSSRLVFPELYEL